MNRANREAERRAATAGPCFCIYITGQGSRSRRAVAGLRRLCDAYAPGGHDIEIVDVLATPEMAVRDGVAVTPAVLRTTPLPARWVFGELTDSGRAAAALGLTDHVDDSAGSVARGGGRPVSSPVTSGDLDGDGAEQVSADRRSVGPVLDRIHTVPLPGPFRPTVDGRSRFLPARAPGGGRTVPLELVSAVAGGVVVVDEDGIVVFSNEAGDEAFGCPAGHLVGCRLGVPLLADPTLVDPVTPDLRPRTLELRGVEAAWEGRRVHVISVGQVTGRRKAADRPEPGEGRFGEVFRQSPVGLAVLDADLRFVDVNQALARMLGSTPVELAGRTSAEVTLAAHRSEELELSRSLLAGDIDSYEVEKQYVTADDQRFWGHVTASLLHDPSGGPARIMAVIEDVTARRRATSPRWARPSLRDPLTGLASRPLALDRLGLVQARAQRSGEFAAILLVGLDRLEAVNDALGHAAGDAFLVECARRLQGVLRTTDTAARLDGDDFLLFCEDLGPDVTLAKATALEVAERVAGALAVPVTLADGRAQTTASIGIALTNGEDRSVDVLLARAASAMERARAPEARGHAVFEPEHRAERAGRMQVAAGLRRAISSGELVVHYQPIAGVVSGRIVAVEAMVRWNHPTRGLLLPDAFIVVAEESRLIIPLGDAVLREACIHVARWRKTSHPDLRLMVNVSPRQLGCDVFHASVAGALRASGLEPDALHVELTEGTLIEAAGSILSELEGVRDLGVHLGLDDFGTGYASLTYLQSLPVDFVKIDGSFVSGLETSSEDQAVVKAVIGLGQALGLRVIAEGVESELQRKVLEEMGCELGQGWHFGYPQPAGEMTALLASGD